MLTSLDNAFSRRSKNNLRKRVNPKIPGTAPGVITHVGKKMLDHMVIHIHDYSTEHLVEKVTKKPKDCLPFLEKSDSVTWFQVMGLHDTQTLKLLLDDFNIHPLIQEDIANTGQRAKVEFYDNQIFIVLKMIHVEHGKIFDEQISLILGPNFVFSFQESDFPVFKAINERLQFEQTRLRKNGNDFAAYALLDLIIDFYFVALDNVSERIDVIEDALLLESGRDLLIDIHNLKRELSRFRKKVWPLRDSLNTLIRDDNPLIKEETKLYIRDVYDHLIQVIDTLDNFREIVTSLHDMYMTNLSNKMNEVMQVLTIIATIFIPLTFIAGVYGMNFRYMPELEWVWAYPAIWGVMVITTGGMILYFKKKNWF